MNKFDFDLYKKQNKKIVLTDNQKKLLIVRTLDSDEKEDNIVDFENARQYRYRKISVFVASILIFVSLAFIFNIIFHKSNNFYNLNEFSMTVSLCENSGDGKSKEYRINEENSIIVIDDKSMSYKSKKSSANPLDFHIKGSNIEYIDISSQNENFIIYTYKTEDDFISEMFKSNYTRLDFTRIKNLGWMPSYNNLIEFDNSDTELTLSEKEKYNKYLSDEVLVTVYYKDKSIARKKIVISYDNNCNYIVKLTEE